MHPESGESFVWPGRPLTHLTTRGTVVPQTLAGVSEDGIVAESPHTGAEVGVDRVETDPGLPPVHHQSDQSPSSSPLHTAALM